MDPFYKLCFVFAFVTLSSSVPCSFVITCWLMADLLDLWCVMFSIFFLSNMVSRWPMWYLIESILDLCLLSYFHQNDLFIRIEMGFEIDFETPFNHI